MARFEKWLSLILVGVYFEPGSIVVIHDWPWHPVIWLRAQISRLTYKKVKREFITMAGPIPEDYKPTK